MCALSTRERIHGEGCLLISERNLASLIESFDKACRVNAVIKSYLPTTFEGSFTTSMKIVTFINDLKLMLMLNSVGT